MENIKVLKEIEIASVTVADTDEFLDWVNNNMTMTWNHDDPDEEFYEFKEVNHV